jgi:two-component system cell cycle sensor histidine kinase/response regulator CckA
MLGPAGGATSWRVGVCRTAGGPGADYRAPVSQQVRGTIVSELEAQERLDIERPALPGGAAPADLRSPDQFRIIFDSVTDGILIFEPNGRILEANPVVCQRLGYTRDELLARTIPELDTAASAALFEARIALVCREGFATFEIEHMRKDGSTLPLEVGSRTMRFDGKAAILSVQRDITERRRAEAEAREQARLVEELLDAIPTPIVSKDCEGRIRQCNRAFIKSWGLTRDQVLGKSISELGLPGGDQYAAIDASVIHTGQVIQHESWVPVVDGARRILMTRAPMRWEDGGIRGTVTTAVDITERYLVEQALRQSEERFRTLFESASDSIFMIEADGRFLDVNRAAAECLGYTKDEMRAMSIADICPPEYGPLIPVQLAEALAHGRKALENTHVRRDGSTIPVEVVVTAVELEGRQVLISIARDVSERKRAEAERTVLEDRLRQAQKMEGIGRLASGIAHDFNNLLTAIAGYADLAAVGLAQEDKRRKDIEQIRQASDRAASLVRQLLLFARGNAMEPQVIRLGDVVDRLKPMLERLIGEDVELTVEVAASQGSMRADPGQIEQVILNLAVNARDAMRRGGRLRIRAVEVELDEETAAAAGTGPGPSALLEVSDTGSGMDSATLEHLFEPFFTTKGPGEGTGLGLATVYGIVHQSGGSIRVRSELGRGSTFSIYFPCVAEEIDQLAGSELPAAQGDAGRGRRIMVVEDNEAVRAFAVRVLEEAGYLVTAAETGPTAVALGRGAELDLLLTDVVMPSMRGAEVAAEMRASHPDLPVLYMSGYSDRALDMSGHTDYLPKPFSPGELLARVAKVLSGSRTGL